MLSKLIKLRMARYFPKGKVGNELFSRARNLFSAFRLCMILFTWAIYVLFKTFFVYDRLVYHQMIKPEMPAKPNTEICTDATASNWHIVKAIERARA